MTETIFDAPVDRQEDNPLDNLVGEGKKFKNYEDLAKGKLEADRFIEQLKAEQAELKADLAARDKLEEVLDRLASRNNDDPYERPHQERNDGSGQPAISSGDIDRLIETKITRRETERTARENLEQAKTKLKEIFGQDYVKKLKERSEALDLDEHSLNEMAKKSPTAFLELVAPKASGERPFTPPRSSATSEQFTYTSQAQPGTKAWYDNLKKTDSAKYWSPAVQMKMHNDAIKAAREGRSF